MPIRSATIQTGCWIGIDPGASGAICTLIRSPQVSHNIFRKMPTTEQEIWEVFQILKTYAENFPMFALIEKVGGYVGGGEGEKGGGAANGNSMFKFGRSYGTLRMALIGNQIPFDEVPPQKWQKEFGLTRAKGEKKNVFKNRGKAKAQQLFPSENIIGDTADGVLIAEYCRRTRST